MTETVLPKAFIWRRIHSLTGLWLVVFLIQHLLTNSQAALLFGEDGHGFIHSVNAIHDLPFLPLIEVFVLGVPIILHAIWGMQYLRTSKQNAYGRDPKHPLLSEYPRNRAYNWQRITSWLLVLGIVAHVVHMRFIEYPDSARLGDKSAYMVRLDVDEGLPTVAARLGVDLLGPNEIDLLANQPPPEGDNSIASQTTAQWTGWINTLTKQPLEKNQVIAVAADFGTAELLIVRETFKMPIMLLLYTLLVISTCYHAFNGLWTALISWGIVLSARSQKWMLNGCKLLMIAVMFLGLVAVWGTYWINLKT